MTEETLFAMALERNPAERAAFLDEACSGNAALRERIAALLQSHEHSRFLATPAVQRAAEILGSAQTTATGQLDPPDGEEAAPCLDFLTPADKPESLGRLGHYDIQEVVGQGGMGIVLKAFDEKLHRVVAIKVMPVQLAASATARRRFAREAKVAAAVSHEHVVTIHAVEETGGLPYIVMQYVAGMSLEQRIQRDGPLALQEILRIGRQTATGLAAAHAQGLIHRDIKPANILLENGVERVKITDFGLARAADDASLTQSGVVAGTPHYMAPEQARGESLDARTDLFSLGSVLYAMCTGRCPFRAGASMAILKRVCEETPTPIREINPEIPDWLAAIVDKLHAKQPADRFQSAAEVANLLGQHLAHLQHPSVVGQPLLSATPRQTRMPAPRSRRPWMIAAAVLLVCLLGGLSLTEAIGVSNVRGSLIRVFTSHGTLAVEVDDPNVKVTIEGDGGVVITGAGAQEVRLRPGSYRVQADKDGHRIHLEKELVSISKGGRETVRVKLESPSAPAGKGDEASNIPRDAFVLLGGLGVSERKFDTLEDAVLRSNAGDTIEIRGDGPFVCDGVAIRHPLVIRAAASYTPSITLSQASADTNTPLLKTSASLVLEGLELRRIGGAVDPFSRILVASLGEALHVANCRLILNADTNVGPIGTSIAANVAAFSLRNCELKGNAGNTSAWQCTAGGRCNIENCVSAVGGIGLGLREPDVRDISIRIRGNTFVGDCLKLTCWSKPNLPENGEAAPLIRLDFSRNVTRWDAARQAGILYFHQYNLDAPFSAAEAEAHLPQLIRLEEQQNVHLSGTRLLRLAVDWKHLEGSRGHDLADWNRLWNQSDTGSLDGNVRLQGGDLLRRTQTAPEKLTPEDFRLRPDSAGYCAGPDGKDLGADVDLVGPGAAYERWKKTPEYQQWRKETGQQN